jgi:virulence factor Mce-like protein
MRRISLIAALIAAAGSAFAATAVGEDSHTYFIELDNAFGLSNGSEVKVAGVTQGTVERLLINPEKRAVVKVELSGPLSALGEDTVCSSEPQSLIAEYFIDCEPKGPPLEEGEGSDEERASAPDIPVEQTRQTVQNDLVQNTFRQSYRDRLRLLINEFGTALAGNPENLNAAIRRGAPALTQLRKVTRILGDQSRIIRGLNVNADRIMARLADRRRDVRRFVENARDTTRAAAERRDDLSATFRDLDEFLVELTPTMRNLNELAVRQTPLLRDLRLAGPGLGTLAGNLPEFNSAATTSLTTLGSAATVGARALRKGTDEIGQLARSTKNAASAADHLSAFLRDIDDPDRAVEVDRRAQTDTGRDGPTGYTGLEGLLNYVYYQAGALSQFDEIGHLLHFTIFEVGTGPCEGYNAGPEVPAAGGGTTTDLRQADRCVAWLGPNQPGINQFPGIEPYHPSVCPDGSTDESICDPAGSGAAAGASKAKPARRTQQALAQRGGNEGRGKRQGARSGEAAGGRAGDPAFGDLLGFLLDDGPPAADPGREATP